MGGGFGFEKSCLAQIKRSSPLDGESGSIINKLLECFYSSLELFVKCCLEEKLRVEVGVPGDFLNPFFLF